MPPEIIFLSVSAAVAVLLGIGALVAAIRARREGANPDEQPDGERGAVPTDKYDIDTSALERRGRGSYHTAVRVLWWVSIAAVLIGVGLSEAYGTSQAAIYAIGAIGVGAVILLHDVLPDRLRSGPVVAFEIALAIGLTTAILVLTGHGSSPFVFGYNLVAVAVALALGGPVALVVATLASLSYLGVLFLDPNIAAFTAADLLRFGLQMGSIWLLAYVAGVFASGERRMRASVLQMSRTDALTGLYNRSQLFPTLEQEVQRTRRSERGFCLLMIDLDGLKAVNDSYGHHRGDEVLRHLGSVIRHSIRLVDTAYRYGGDEFLVLLPETDFAGAFVVAEKVRIGTEEMGLAADDGELMTSVSIGLVSCPEDGTSAEDLMIAADRAMYQAKSLGKNQISGNPRPRRLPYTPPAAVVPSTEPAPAQPIAPEAADAVVPPAEPIETPPVIEVQPLREDELTPISVGSTNSREPTDETEADPTEVRKQIAAARLNMDPDHQIRRAMDAFLSPTRPNGDSGN